MPLPAATAACNVPDNVCCDTLWLMGERIRQVALAAVVACSDPTCAEQTINSWQTEGDRSGAVRGDTLVVSFSGLSTAIVERSRRNSPVPTPITRASYRVELSEQGWPIVREHAATATVALPDPQLIHALAKHARGHAESMWRALLRGATTTRVADQLFPSTSNPHVIHRGVTVGNLTGGPTGPHVRYSLTISVDHVLP